MKVYCQNCGNKFDYHMYVGLCPKCGKIYRTRSQNVEKNSGIILNATYSSDEYSSEMDEYWNHSHASNGSYIPGRPTQNVTAYPEKMYQKTQLNKAYRPPQSIVSRPVNTAQQNQKAAITFTIVFMIIFILTAILSILGNF